MTYCASHSKAEDVSIALDAICDELATGLEGVPPDISFLFVSHYHADRFEELASLVYRENQTRLLLGCTGEAIAGGSEEMESGPAISLWAAVLPEAGAVFVFGKPFSAVPNSLIDYFAEELPGIPLIGGMASGGAGPEWIHRERSPV